MPLPAVPSDRRRHDLVYDLVLPTLLFAALGGMTWAVRGCSGFGAVAGCIFAGVTWGAAWWFLAHDPAWPQSRRYSSGWVVLALTVGIGLAGAGLDAVAQLLRRAPANQRRKGRIRTHRAATVSFGCSSPECRGPDWELACWPGADRCAKCGPGTGRCAIACGMGGATLGRYLFDHYPEYFLPLYSQIEDRYRDLETNPTLKRLINDSGAAIQHLGLYLGFLAFEIGRREGKNVFLISTVGLVNGAGWALWQNWKWAPAVWEGAQFNWWRCWESSGGISIGIALGMAYYLVNRRMGSDEQALVAARRALSGPNFEWLLTYLGLSWILSLALRFSMGGWGALYFAVVMIFGALYYRRFQGPPGKGQNSAPSGPNQRPRLHAGALLLAVAMAGSLFLPSGRSLVGGQAYVLAILAAGTGWYLMNRDFFDRQRQSNTPPQGDPNIERWGLYLGLLAGLGLSIRNGLKGWFNIYRGDEEYWSGVVWQYLGPVYLVLLIVIAAAILRRPWPRDSRDHLFPHAYGLMWLVLLVQNALALLVTGPLSHWSEAIFAIYYGLLLVISGLIVFHYHTIKQWTIRPPTAA